MSSMTSELRQIEGKVIEISRLQEVFANNVLIQVIVLKIFDVLENVFLFDLKSYEFILKDQCFMTAF